MREKTRRHQQLEILHERYILPAYEKDELQKLEAGFIGELEFDGIIEPFIKGSNIIHIKDYSFYPEDAPELSTKSREDASHVQLDNLVVAKDFLYTFEIKNYSFDLIYKDSKWYFENGNEFASPLLQVARQRDTLGKMLYGFGSEIRMFNVVVFINKRQTIFNLPAAGEIIVRSNLHKKLAKAMAGNHYDHSRLISRLEERKVDVVKHQRDTTVGFRELAKGVFCGGCGRKVTRKNRDWFRCRGCEVDIPILDAAARLIRELKVLNRSWKVTPSLIQAFSDGEISEFYVRSNVKRGRLGL
ncbi:nuclease-related domain-containing protein [Salinicoccus kekensis]|uniref:Nuclease-like protein n=1 Tax=Salinicoccus kekensis TaxID=714307 RepID=A0A285U7R5_9STAP|nr:nuclease-related domain-containing protein [Salinicoccus kekensis]SOC37974.1 nuclease-like protein [Salinicoccus kekensis]